MIVVYTLMQHHGRRALFLFIRVHVYTCVYAQDFPPPYIINKHDVAATRTEAYIHEGYTRCTPLTRRRHKRRKSVAQKRFAFECGRVATLRDALCSAARRVYFLPFRSAEIVVFDAPSIRDAAVSRSRANEVQTSLQSSPRTIFRYRMWFRAVIRHLF